MNLYSFLARFSQQGLPSGGVQTSCDRCGDATVTGLPGPDCALLEAVVWARDHRCPPSVPVLHARELVSA